MPAAKPSTSCATALVEAGAWLARNSALVPKTSRSTKSATTSPSVSPKNSAERLVAKTMSRIAAQKLSAA